MEAGDEDGEWWQQSGPENCTKFDIVGCLRIQLNSMLIVFVLLRYIARTTLVGNRMESFIPILFHL